jgi:hypothetical protein
MPRRTRKDILDALIGYYIQFDILLFTEVTEEDFITVWGPVAVEYYS